MPIRDSITALIGSTPAVRLRSICRGEDIVADIIAKVEYMNPGGSVKDRIALSMVEDAEQKGLLRPGGTIIEPTSGNTGVGLSLMGAVRGYRVILTMPDSMSVERRRLAAAYGTEIVLTPGAEGMAGAIARAEELRAAIPGAVILQQFSNPANPSAHYRTTGPELVRDAHDAGISIDALVAGVGTGGTLCGTARAVKETFPQALVIGVEPATSAVLSGKSAGAHGIQGIGAGFRPDCYDGSVVDEVLPVSDSDAMQTARRMAREEGLLVGISSGAAVYAALQVARRKEMEGKHIFVLLPDTGERYLSTPLFAE